MKILHSFQNLSQVESDLPFCKVSPSHDVVQKATLVSPVGITRVVFWINPCIRTEKPQEATDYSSNCSLQNLQHKRLGYEEEISYLATRSQHS